MHTEQNTNGTRRITLILEVDVTDEEYALNYGHTDDIAEYTETTARDAIAERLKLVGWGTLVERPISEPLHMVTTSGYAFGPFPTRESADTFRDGRPWVPSAHPQTVTMHTHENA